MSETLYIDPRRPEDPGYESAVSRAVTSLKDGRLVVLPTDTVYGIAADAFSAPAVGALLRAKDRGPDYPVPVLVGAKGVLHGLVTEAPAAAVALTDRFWPGPLTVIVKYSPSLSWDLGSTGGTVAVRMPDNPVALSVLTRTGPLAVSSANKHGKRPARSAADAIEQLGGSVDIYLEAGATADDVPSTIVDCTRTPPVIVREGALSREQLASVIDDIR